MDFFHINLKAVNNDTLKDGAVVSAHSKELGIADIYPQAVRHSPNGHMIAIFSDTEYSIHRAQNFKNSGFGQGTDLVWAHSGDYAVREAFSIKIFQQQSNQLVCEIKTDFVVEQLFGGPLLAAKAADFVVFYDWSTAKVIRRIDVAPKKIVWNEKGT